jgi:hypothetical protein
MKIAEKGTPLEDCVIERMINLAQPVYPLLPLLKKNFLGEVFVECNFLDTFVCE